MQIRQLSVMVGVDEIRAAIQKGLPQMIEKAGAAGLDGLSDPDVTIEKGLLVFSIKKKVGFMPVKFSASIGVKPTVDGEGVEITLARVAAAVFGNAGAAQMLMQQVAQAVAGKPGLSVDGTTLTVTKEALARLPNLEVLGKVNQVDILDDRIEIAIG